VQDPEGEQTHGNAEEEAPMNRVTDLTPRGKLHEVFQVRCHHHCQQRVTQTQATGVLAWSIHFGGIFPVALGVLMPHFPCLHQFLQ